MGHRYGPEHPGQGERDREKDMSTEMSTGGDGSPEIAEVEAVRGADMVAAGAVLVDVREPEEWQAGHAPDARHLPLGQLGALVEQLPPDAPIVVICRSGARSGVATKWLTDQGYDAVNLAGGMLAWAASGLPVLADDGTPGAVV